MIVYISVRDRLGLGGLYELYIFIIVTRNCNITYTV